MILFDNFPASLLPSVITIVLILILAILSLLLNPTVFVYNIKKSSIAGFLFCVVSATDFLICIAYPFVILYYSITVKIEDLTCRGNGTVSRQLQNCYAHPTPLNLVTTIILDFLDCVVFMTTGVLAVVRSIQIRFPFFPITRSTVAMVLCSLIILQNALLIFCNLSPFGEKVYLPTMYKSISTNPYGFSAGKTGLVLNIFIYDFVLLIVQAAAVIATLGTAWYLFRQRTVQGTPARLLHRRIKSGIKVLLTNFTSFYVILTSLTWSYYAVMVRTFNDDGVPLMPLYGDSESWGLFYLDTFCHVLSSVWNPAIFICLTPKSRATFRRSVKLVMGGFSVSAKRK